MFILLSPVIRIFTAIVYTGNHRKHEEGFALTYIIHINKKEAVFLV